VLFSLVVGAGLFIRNASHNIHVPESLGALGSFGDFNWGDGDGGNLFATAARSATPGNTRRSSSPHNTSGFATQRSDRRRRRNRRQPRRPGREELAHVNPQSVQLVPVLTQSGVTICAMGKRGSSAATRGDYRLNGVKKNDVAVRFTVQLPRNVPISASTVNGGCKSTASAPRWKRRPSTAASP